MADQKLTQLPVSSVPALDDLIYEVDVSDTTDSPQGSSKQLTAERFFANLLPQIAQGRVTTETGVPISTTDRAAQATIYWTPYLGDKVALYDGTRWKLYTFAEVSFALSGLTTDKNYDVFLFDNAGVLTLELSAAWSTDIARTDALATVNGVLVKSVANTRRYLGTIRTTGTTTTEDSLTKRFVWNHLNRVPRHMRKEDTTDTWTYDTNVITAFRQARAQTANQLDYVVGQADVLVEAQVQSGATSAAGGNVVTTVGIGVDSTTVSSAQSSFVADFVVPAAKQPLFADYKAYSALGRHFLAWLERATDTNSDLVFFSGDDGFTGGHSGLLGTLMG